jgi:hypothetical protein
VVATVLETRDTLSADALAVGDTQLGKHAWGAVDRERAVVDLADQDAPPRVLERPGRGGESPPGVEALTGHTDRLEEQGDGELCGLLGNEPKRVTVDRSP